MSEKMLGSVDPEVADLLRRLPPAWLEVVGTEDAFMVGPAVAAALCRSAEDPTVQTAPMVWQAIADVCVAGTPFHGIRMEAQMGPVCAVASPHTASTWYSWLPLGTLSSQPVTAPLVLVLHDVDRRARELRDCMGPWAESAGCFVLSPEFLTDPRAPGGDLAYATGPQAAEVALQLVDELAERVGVSFPRLVVMAIGSGAAVVPALLRTAPERVAGCVLLSPAASPVLDVLGRGAQPEKARDVPVVVIAGGADTLRPSQGSSVDTGLGDARRVVSALARAELDVRLELVHGSGGEVLSRRPEEVVGPDRPTAMLHAAATAATGLLLGGPGAGR